MSTHESGDDRGNLPNRERRRLLHLAGAAAVGGVAGISAERAGLPDAALQKATEAIGKIDFPSVDLSGISDWLQREFGNDITRAQASLEKTLMRGYSGADQTEWQELKRRFQNRKARYATLTSTKYLMRKDSIAHHIKQLDEIPEGHDINGGQISYVSVLMDLLDEEVEYEKLGKAAEAAFLRKSAGLYGRQETDFDADVFEKALATFAQALPQQMLSDRTYYDLARQLADRVTTEVKMAGYYAGDKSGYLISDKHLAHSNVQSAMETRIIRRILESMRNMTHAKLRSDGLTEAVASNLQSRLFWTAQKLAYAFDQEKRGDERLFSDRYIESLTVRTTQRALQSILSPSGRKLSPQQWESLTSTIEASIAKSLEERIKEASRR